jgi:MFS family permease
MATPQALTIAYSVFPPERRGTAFGFQSGAAGLGTVAGPLLGGFVTSTFGWRWVFYLNVPIAAALVVGTFIVVPRLPARRRRRYDWIGVLLLGGSLLAVVFALAEGQRYRWGAVLGAITIPGILVAGLALAAVFVAWERGRPEPLLPLPLFKDANLSIAVWLNFSMYFALAFVLAYQVYLQAGLGLSTLVAGLALIPTNATYAITSPLGGWLTDRIGGKYIVMTGIGLFALGLAGLAVVATSESTLVASIVPLAVGGLGMAAFFSSVTVLAIRRVPPEMAGAASGVINAGRWVGAVVGLAVVGAIMQVALTVTLGAGAAANATAVPARPVGALARRALADGYVFALRWVLVGMVVLLVIGVLLCLGFATERSPEPAPAAAPSPSPANRPRSGA